MLRKAATTIVLPLTCLACLVACSSAEVPVNEPGASIAETKLSISESCDLIDDLAVEHNVEEERALADIALMAKNTQPMIDFLATSILIFDEVASRASDDNMRSALYAQVRNYQLIKEVVEDHSSDDPSLSIAVQDVKTRLNLDAMPYIQESCPGSIVNPSSDSP